MLATLYFYIYWKALDDTVKTLLVATRKGEIQQRMVHDMKHSRNRIFYYAMSAFVTLAIAGCGNDESSANSGDRWFDAGNVEQAYRSEIQMNALNAGEKPFEADTSCMAILPLAQESLNDSSNTGTLVQLMYKTCNDAGLKFQNKARCEADRLQVLCR